MIEDTSETDDRFQYFIDSHCHVKSLTLSRDTADIDDDDDININNNIKNNNTSSLPCDIKSAVLCGTHPDKDWSLIERLAAVKEGNVRVYPPTIEHSSPIIIPGFGIHPWFVPYKQEETEHEDYPIVEKEKRNNNNSTNNNATREEDASSFSCCCGSTTTAAAENNNNNGNIFSTSRSHPSTLQQQQEEKKEEKEKERTAEELLSLLEYKLRRYPHAIVGEIGLDKLRGPPPSVQRDLFIAQMRIAAQYNRPVSVHCVRSFGLMLQILRELPVEYTPPAIVMHGFTGTLEFAKSVMSIRKKQQIQKDQITFSSSYGGRSIRKTEPLRVFFGVGTTTSLRVKGFTAHTLPFLLQQGRVLLETDAHHSLFTSHSSALNTSSTVGIMKREGEIMEKKEKEKEEVVGKVLRSSTVVNNVERLMWDSAGCGQLRELQEIVNSAAAVMEERLRNGCEEAFSEVFGPFLTRREEMEKGE